MIVDTPVIDSVTSSIVDDVDKVWWCEEWLGWLMVVGDLFRMVTQHRQW